MMGAEDRAIRPRPAVLAGSGRLGRVPSLGYDLWSRSGLLEWDSGATGLLLRLRFCAHALQAWEATDRLLQEGKSGLLARMLRERPQLFGLITAPYICSRWSATERVGHFIEHVGVLERLGWGLDFSVFDSLELARLDPLSGGLHLVLDKPSWFHREGVLALNLFEANRRLFTISFALAERGGGRTAIIGGIQGRRLPGILDRYREITKLAHGLRPRDLLLALLRAYCRAIGVTEIIAVSDGSRHHRSVYFGKDSERDLSLDYNEIWADRGGTPLNADFYALPLEQPSRDSTEIPSKKRGLYRRRQSLLDELEASVRAGASSARPVRRPEAE